MNMQHNVSLKNLTMMRLGGDAKMLVEVESRAEVAEAVRYARENNIEWYVLGGGSNTLAHDDGFAGLIILNKIKGFEIIDENDDQVTISVGAGEVWDEFVQRTVDMDLSGVECLSAIPGTVGAAPVQNIGAYGQEVSTSIVSVNAYDAIENVFVTLDNSECEFSYRHSIFRGKAAGRYIITSVTFALNRQNTQPPFYAAIQNYLDTHEVTETTPQVLRTTVVRIRSDKLPDPKIKPNTGSFFKNAIISSEKLNALLKKYPNIPHYEVKEGYKIPTGWLIEQSGLKGSINNGMRVHDKNALVLINESASSYQDLAKARQLIIGTVQKKFDITIEQEPLEIPSKKA